MAGRRSVERSKAGLSRELQVIRERHLSDPSRGGSCEYPKYEREEALQLSEQVGVTAAVELVRASRSSLTRWRVRLDSYEMTGNRQWEVLTGRDQMLMVICYFIFPDADADEVAAFIYRNGGRLYSRPAIYK